MSMGDTVSDGPTSSHGEAALEVAALVDWNSARPIVLCGAHEEGAVAQARYITCLERQVLRMSAAAHLHSSMCTAGSVPDAPRHDLRPAFWSGVLRDATAMFLTAVLTLCIAAQLLS